MKKIIFFSLIYFVLFLNKVLGCSCVPLNEIKTKDDLEEYDFVALVKVEKLMDSTFASSASVTVLELFKGSYQDRKISFWGFGTSCDMSVQESDTWIIFGNYQGDYFIRTGFCTHSVKYIESKRASELLYTLRSLYKSLPNKKQFLSFWEMIQNMSKDIYTETKLFLYQAFILLKSIFHGF